MDELMLTDAICLRCGYPHRVPDHIKDRIKTCRQCRTPEENRMRDRAIARWKEKRNE